MVMAASISSSFGKLDIDTGSIFAESLSLSQSTGAKEGLGQIRDLIGAGYLRDRGTGMSDLVITSRPILAKILAEVKPYVIFKRQQVEKALEILALIRPRMEAMEFLEVSGHVDRFATLNHSKSKRISAADVERHLRGRGVSVPVTTLSLVQREDEVASPEG